MRLFIAIDLPESVKEYLQKLQNDLSYAKISKTNDFHITLKFLGECSEKRLEKIKAALRPIRFVPFEATLSHIGRFGGRMPRVIWIGAEVPPSFLTTIAEIEKAMSKLDFPKENRFIPHITLARVKFVENQEYFQRSLEAIRVKPMKFPVKGYYLFESRGVTCHAPTLSPHGATHIKLAEFP